MSHNSAPMVFRHRMSRLNKVNTCREKKKDVFRGGGGSMSVSGAADRSVPIPVGAGGRSSVVVHSKAILYLQKT